MWLRLAAAALAALGSAGLLMAQEQVEIDLPAEVVLDGAFVGGSSEPSRPVTVSFSQALLAPGRVLRLSVRAEGGDPGCRLRFATKNARGGIGRSGRVGDDDFVPVFESFPRAMSGGVEISWIFETTGEIRRAGRRSLTLRWRIESVPIPGWMERGTAGDRPGPSVHGTEPSAGEPVPGTPRPGPGVWEKPDRKDRRRPPAEEVP